MARPRQTRAALARLNTQFIQYGVTAPITYAEYVKLVDTNPITRRELKKLFIGRWERLLKALGHYYPNVYEDAKKAHKPEPVSKGLDALRKRKEVTSDEDE